jgi:2-oxoglutarate dehydrogenase complex dehydrogenase (E1) component-like enzyme
MYSEALVAAGVLEQAEVAKVVGEHTDWLNEHYKQIDTYQPERSNLKEQWTGLTEPGSSITYWDTGLPHGNKVHICT